MKVVHVLYIVVFLSFCNKSNAQKINDDLILAQIRTEGTINSQAMKMLSELTDIYGQRLTGSREYYAAANWIFQKMKSWR